MKKHFLITLLVATMLLSLLVGCGSKKTQVITAEQAQQIALEQAGLTKDQAGDVHTHIVTENGIPCFSVHISSSAGDYSYIIAANGGEVISGGEGSGH